MGSLVSNIGTLFGGGPNNAEFQASGAQLTQPVTSAQTNQAITNATNAGNTAGTAVAGQQTLANTLSGQAQTGVNTQDALTQALTAQAQGQGPNPALAQLQQATGANVANQAALMAGSQGASSNPGLIARQAAMQGANTQQQAVGQGATMQAQQQLAAQQQLQNLANTQIGQTQTGTNAAAQGALGQEQAQTAQQNSLLQAMQGYNTAQVQNTASQNAANAAMSQTNANNSATAIGGLLSGISGGLTSGSSGGGEGGGGGGSSMMAGEGGSSMMGMAAQGGEIEGSGMVMPPHLHHMATIYHPMHKMSQGGNVLNANARAHIAKKNFALPGGKYPIEDINHARNALARVSQHGSEAEKAKVRAAVHKKYPSVGKPKKYDEGGDVTPDNPAEIPTEMPADTQTTASQTSAPSDQIESNPLEQAEKPEETAPTSSSDYADPAASAIGDQLGIVPANPYIGSSAPIQNVALQKQQAQQAQSSSSGGGGSSSMMSMLPLLAMAAKGGGEVPGNPKHPKKNTPSNDTVPILATPKEIVLPLTVTQSDDPGEAAKKFVIALLKKKGDGDNSKEHSEFKKALSKAISSRKGK